MALYTTYSQIGIREDLSNMIHNIAPTETPFVSMVDKGSAAKNRFSEWQTDDLAAVRAAPADAAVEGSDATLHTATPTVRLRNYTQIFKKAIAVSGTSIAVNTAGRKNELVYQLDKRTKELKREMEGRFTSGNGSAVGDASSTPREAAGFSAFLNVNKLHGIAGATDGTTPGFNVGTGLVSDVTRGSSSSLRALTHTLTRAIVKMCWDSGGEPTVIMVGSFNKQVISAFSQYSQAQHNVSENFKRNQLIAAFGVYVSDFGALKIVPNRFQHAQDMLLIDTDKVAIKYLRNWKIEPINKTGDAEKRQLIAEATLEVKAPAAHGKVAELTTS